MIAGLPCNQNSGFVDGLASSNAMALGGIKASDNILAVVSWLPSSGVYVTRDATDFTAAAGTVTAGSIDLSAAGMKAWFLWTDAPAA